MVKKVGLGSIQFHFRSSKENFFLGQMHRYLDISFCQNPARCVQKQVSGNPTILKSVISFPLVKSNMPNTLGSQTMFPKISVWKFGNLADSGRFWHAQSPSRLFLLVSQCLRDTEHSCTFLLLQILTMLTHKTTLSF